MAKTVNPVREAADAMQKEATEIGAYKSWQRHGAYLWIPESASNRPAFVSGVIERVIEQDEDGYYTSDNYYDYPCEMMQQRGVGTVCPFPLQHTGSGIWSHNQNCGTEYRLIRVRSNFTQRELEQLQGWMFAKLGVTKYRNVVELTHLDMITEYLTMFGYAK